jgi:hypothetical protein
VGQEESGQTLQRDLDLGRDSYPDWRLACGGDYWGLL